MGSVVAAVEVPAHLVGRAIVQMTAAAEAARSVGAGGDFSARPSNWASIPKKQRQRWVRARANLEPKGDQVQ